MHEAKSPGYRPEAVMLVEPRGILVGCVHHHEPSSNGLGRGEHSLEGFSQQRASQTAAVQRSIERQPSQEYRRNLTSATSAERAWQLLPLKKMSGERVVADDGVVASVPDERPRRSAFRSSKRVLGQPAVESGLAAGEPAEFVSLAQLLGDKPQFVCQPIRSRARCAARASAAFGRGVSSSADIRSSKNPAGTTVTTSCSSSTSSARCSAAARTKSLVDS